MDIDIDISTKVKPAHVFPDGVKASNINNDVLVEHPVGYYLQSIPYDQVLYQDSDKSEKLSSIPYDQAESFGFMKIDFIHNTIIDEISSRDELDSLVEGELDWSLFENATVVSRLFHLSKHIETLRKVHPKSVEDIADILALIRPSKIKLLDHYLRNKQKVRKSLFVVQSKSDMKKSHCFAYALLIKAQITKIYNEEFKQQL